MNIPRCTLLHTIRLHHIFALIFSVFSLVTLCLPIDSVAYASQPIEPTTSIYTDLVTSRPVFSDEGTQLRFTTSFGLNDTNIVSWNLSEQVTSITGRLQLGFFSAKFKIVPERDGIVILGSKGNLTLKSSVLSDETTVNLPTKQTIFANWSISETGRWFLLPGALSLSEPILYDFVDGKFSENFDAEKFTPPEHKIGGYVTGAITDEGTKVFLVKGNFGVMVDGLTGKQIWSQSVLRGAGLLKVRFVDKGKVLVSGPHSIRGKPGRVRLEFYSAEDGRLLRQLETKPLKDYATDISGDRIAVLLIDGGVEVHNIKKTTPPDILEGSDSAKYITISGDGRRVGVVKKPSGGRSHLLIYDLFEPEIPTSKITLQEKNISNNQQQESRSPELIVQTGHSGHLRSAEFSSDGTLIASVGTEGNVWIWHAESGRAIRNLKIPDGMDIPSLIAFEPDNQNLLVASGGGWSLPLNGSTGQKHISSNFLGDPKFMGYANNKDTIVVANIGEVSTFDAKTKSYLKNIFKPQSGALIDVTAISRDDSILTIAESNDKRGLVSVLDLSNEKLLGVVPTKEGEISAVATTNSGNIVFVATQEKITAYSVPKREILWSRDFGATVLALQMTMDNQTIVVGGAAKSILMLGASDGNLKHEIPSRFDGNRLGQVTSLKHSNTDKQLLVGFQFQPLNLMIVDLENIDNQPKFLQTFVSSPTFVRFGPDPDNLWIGYGGATSLWSLKEGRKTKTLPTTQPRQAAISPNKTGVLLTSSKKNGTELSYWSPKTGELTLLPPQGDPAVHHTTWDLQNHTLDGQFSPSGKFVFVRSGQDFSLFSSKTGQRLFQNGGKFTKNIAFSRSEDLVAVQASGLSGKSEIHIISTKYMLIETRIEVPKRVNSIKFSSDDQAIFAFNSSDQYGLGIKVDITSGKLSNINFDITHRSFLQVNNVREGKILTLANDGVGKSYLTDVETGKNLMQFFYSERTSFAYMSPDQKALLVFHADGVVNVWDIKTGEQRYQLDANVSTVEAVDFSRDGKLLVIGERDGTVSLWQFANGEFVARLVETSVDDWAVIDGNGRFDSSRPGDMPALSWRLVDDPLNPRPLEIFLREYYEPGLLNRILSNEKFPYVKPPQDLDLITPEVEFLSAKIDGADTISLSLKVGNNDAGIAGELIAKDFKLFRDGQLVRLIQGNVANSSEVIDTGEMIFHFPKIKIPVSIEQKAIRTFSAYAFNGDGVKGETARWTYSYDKSISERKKKAYIISIGVDNYLNASWNLNYATADAGLMAGEMEKRISQTHQFDQVIKVELLSYEGKSSTATKDHIRAVLNRLRGKEADKKLIAEIKNASLLQEVNPEDLVLLSFSGHGFKSDNGEFHLFASDIAQGNGRVIDSSLLQSTFSSNELAMLLADIDAGQFAIILDACNSAASVESPGFKPGPMGSRGLGQLAYDKKMQILTASQAEEVAIESELLGHGILTYALMQEGISKRKADNRPRDGRLDLSEWLNWGTKRVPELYKLIKEGQLPLFTKGFNSQSLGLQEQEFEDLTVQQPRLFDYSSNKIPLTVVQFN